MKLNQTLGRGVSAVHVIFITAHLAWFDRFHAGQPIRAARNSIIALLEFRSFGNPHIVALRAKQRKRLQCHIANIRATCSPRTLSAW